MESYSCHMHPPCALPLKWAHIALINSSAEGNPVSSIALSPDGVHVATGMEDGIIRIWDYKMGLLTRKLNGLEGTPCALAYSPDGTRLVSGSTDSDAIVWDVSSSMQNPELCRLEGHSAEVWSVAFSPNGMYIATATPDCSVRIWDPVDGSQLLVLQAGESVNQAVWKPDSMRVILYGDSGAVCWDVAGREDLVQFREPHTVTWCMSVSKQGDHLVTSLDDHTARIWDIAIVLSGHDGNVYAAAFSDNGSEVVYGGHDGNVVVADSYTGDIKHTWQEDASDEEHIVNSVLFSHSGDLVAAGAADGNVRLYDNQTGNFIAQYMAHTDKVKTVHFVHDDLDLISSSDDGSVRVFSLVDTLRLAL
ncbi:hypothetical protein NM688_g8241 [Phlebia brevispora]|uniref:Uncharacterized protein n=1 Tax=Phlebia brevispora TaxID=194682 RepID=A0ACC1RVH3_9APHY|nr:hypothetical protein NM688_g8241 [Phlebia brevispora]